MRILIYGLNFAPELTGVGKYTGELAQWLNQSQYDVRVISAPPYYPDWEVVSGYSSLLYQIEHFSNIRVYRCPLWIPRHHDGFRRLIHLISFALSSLPIVLWQGLTWRPDVIIVVAPTIFCSLAAWIAAILGSAKVWLHFQDLEFDAAVQLGLLPSSARKLFQAFESSLLHRFDHISAISHEMLFQIQKKGIEESHLFLMPNWTELDAIYPLPRSNLREELRVSDDTVVVLYSGNMGKKQGLDIILEVATYVQQENNILFILCGNGSERRRLESQANKLDNLHFLNLQPEKRLNHLLNLADIHLLPQQDHVNGLVMPSKLPSILACGGAVIATARQGTELQDVVCQAGGVVTPPGNATALAHQVKRLALNKNHRLLMKRIARNYAVENFGKEEILSRFCQQLNCL